MGIKYSERILPTHLVRDVKRSLSLVVFNTYNRLDNPTIDKQISKFSTFMNPDTNIIYLNLKRPYFHIYLRGILILSRNSALDQRLVVGF